MQRVTNCVICKQDEILLLKKPRRGWWYSPGGKMEEEESVLQAVVREVEEETGIIVIAPKVKAISTILIEDQGKIADEWMLFTFFAREWEGEPNVVTEEGELKWHPLHSIETLPMPEGDRLLLKEIKEDSVFVCRFIYTPEYHLLSYDMKLC